MGYLLLCPHQMLALSFACHLHSFPCSSRQPHRGGAIVVPQLQNEHPGHKMGFRTCPAPHSQCFPLSPQAFRALLLPGEICHGGAPWSTSASNSWKPQEQFPWPVATKHQGAGHTEPPRPQVDPEASLVLGTDSVPSRLP